jgi:outer membrane protein assembly factor BamB
MLRQVWVPVLTLFVLIGLFSNTKAGETAINPDRFATGSVQLEGASWPMAGANPQRTSWTPEEVRGRLQPLWFKPFEPYISQRVQIIAADQTLYIATARGLYALDAGSGAERWVFPTQLPLGHSPTVQDGVVYVGGLDHHLYALDAGSGAERWRFEAGAGFQTNPLVVAGRVYAGNRDGFLYALQAQDGQLVWKYPTQGPILYSAAYADGVVYFASQDSHAYALDAQSGELIWRSAKLPGAGFHSFWPVVYRDRVIFAGSRLYRSSSRYLEGGKEAVLEWDDVYPNRENDPDGTWVGPLGQEPGDWAAGTPTLDASRPNVTPNGSTTPITEYFEAKPWRRTLFVLDRQTGQEVTYDFDQDGKPEYAPILWFGTHSGNRYPPIVGGDGVLYQSNNLLSNPFIPWGHISGWKMDTPFIGLPAPGRNAVDEPQGYAAGGNLIYWNRCCDRVGAAFDLRQPGTGWTYFSYNLDHLLPGYNQRYYNPDVGNYTAVYANFGGPNGVYGFHADTNPPIPYQGKVYMHRSNAVIAFAASSSPPQALPLARTRPAPPPGLTRLGAQALQARLAAEIQQMLAAGHLRPGYASHGHFDLPAQNQCGDDLLDYFHHPADTLVTLLQALPHLPPDLQPQVKTYLQAEFAAYPPYRYNHIGWREGAAREAFDLPPEVAGALDNFAPTEGIQGFAWSINPYSFYALWKYAEMLDDPQQAQELLAAAKSSRHLMDSFGNVPEDALLLRMPLVHNAYIAGYLGYLGLEDLAGQPQTAAVRQELERLLALRADRFSPDSAYATAARREDGAYCRTLNVASNFMFLVPELADYLHEHALSKVHAAVAEYESLAPHWFVSFAAEGFGENGLTPLYDGQALFLAKAWILQEPAEELEPYLDVPAFPRGDLFYIQKLVATIEAKESPVKGFQQYLPAVLSSIP